jgi:putative transcriptional regulator
MSKIGKHLIGSVKEAIALGEGDRKKGQVSEVFVLPKIDVRAVRNRARMSQSAFAASFGLSVEAIENWEQGRRQPDVAARAYLTVIDQNPKAVIKALRTASGKN